MELLKPFSLSASIYFLLPSAAIAWPLLSRAPLYPTTFLQSLIYSSLFSFSASRCSPRCSKFFNLLGWALASCNRILLKKEKLIGPLQALTPGSFIPFLSWREQSCILPEALMRQRQSFWKKPRLTIVLRRRPPTPTESREEGLAVLRPLERVQVSRRDGVDKREKHKPIRTQTPRLVFL